LKRLLTAIVCFWLTLIIMCPGSCEPSAEQDFGLATAKPLAVAKTVTVPAKKALKPVARRAKRARPVRRAIHRPVAAKAVAPKKPIATAAKPATPIASNPQINAKAVSTPAQPAVQTPVPAAAPAPVVQAKTAPVREDKIALLLKQKEEPKPVAQTTGDWAKTGLRAAVSLAFVLALAYVTILALKRLSDKRESGPRGSKNLEIVDTLKLNTNSSIHLINVRGKTLLIGSTAGQINVLTEVEADESAEDPQTDKRFAEYLDKYYNGSKYAGPATRMAGMLRDATQHLRGRQPNISNKIGVGDSDES
jgi:flagellar biosynthetic protein FliO